MNATFIVGNGLDMSFEMPTSYKQFYEYIHQTKPNTRNQIYTAIRDDPETWSDFELALGAHTQIIETLYGEDRQKAVDKFRRAFDEVLEDLGDYLQEQRDASLAKLPRYAMARTDFYSGLHGESARKIAAIVGNAPLDSRFITLNYTDTLERLLQERQMMERRGVIIRRIHHAHGELSDYITMGVSNESQISAALTGESRDDLIKPLLLASMDDDRLSVTEEMIESSSIIIIFGTSLGKTDEYIWQKVVNWLGGADDRYVIIHDHNEDFRVRPTRNPSRIKQLDQEARNRLLDHIEHLSDNEKVTLRSRILVVRNTTKLFTS